MLTEVQDSQRKPPLFSYIFNWGKKIEFASSGERWESNTVASLDAETLQTNGAVSAFFWIALLFWNIANCQKKRDSIVIAWHLPCDTLICSLSFDRYKKNEKKKHMLVSENTHFQPTFLPTQETFLQNKIWFCVHIVYAWVQDAPLYFLRDETLQGILKSYGKQME